MVPEIGHYSLIMALCLAFIQSIVPLWGSFNRQGPLLLLAKSTAYGQCVFIGLSFLLLVYAFITNDFSVAYVVQNSHSHLPWLYRICATWGAHEGSLLLWVFILSLWGCLVTFYTQISPILLARVLSVLAMISVGFLLFVLLTSNPFLRVLPEFPSEGRDLNPLLQDPGLSIHPPMLYMGYVGFSVAFAFAIAALISGKFDSSFARIIRPWTLIAWSFLTFGITLGSWWAYRVLGWGGWWFWDPVENASFLPWLSGTALIHSLIVAEKRDAFKAWTILLAICTFSLSLMGTFLVRSGILVSVHSFALDPTRGAFMLYFLAIVIGGSFGLYAWRGYTIKNSGIFQFFSREAFLLTNNAILTCCMLTVLLGTLYPLILDALGLSKISVGSPYFNSVFLPFMMPLLFLMGIGPALQWRNASLVLIVKRFKLTFPISIILAIVLPFFLTHTLDMSVVVGLFLAFWVILATLQSTITKRVGGFNKNRLGMLLAHIGVGITVIGIILSSAYSRQEEVRMLPNDHLQLSKYSIVFKEAVPFKGPNYETYVGRFWVTSTTQKFLLQPELRIYTAQKMVISKTAIRISPFHDLYIALGEKLEQGAWSLRIYYKPFIRWIWLGGVLMLLGGLSSALRLLRVKR